MPVHNQVQLITYPDSLGGNLTQLNYLLAQHFMDLFPGGIHILPPFPSSGDRGFAPRTYFEIDPRFGHWEDIQRIGQHFDVLVDLMVNHISRQSPYFQDFVRRGRCSPYAGMFLTLDKVWPDGKPPPGDLARIFLRRPESPFTDVRIEGTGEVERVWATFGTRDWSEQIDLDVHSQQTRRLLGEILAFFGQQGIKMVRLDAAAYVIKKPGTSCFFVEPEIYEFLEWIQREAQAAGVELLLEVHAHHSIRDKLVEHGYWVYDFVLPALVLHTLFSHSSQKLKQYLQTVPKHQFTTLDTHDGIPILPDVERILDVDQAQKVVEVCLQRGANLNRILSTQHKTPTGFDAHQMNITYYSALGSSDQAYLAARAIQFFTPGVPQVYYVGLLAGENDQEAVLATKEGRAINRHNYSVAEVEQALRRPVVQRLQKLIRFRNAYPAFQGDFSVLNSGYQELKLAWQKDPYRCQLTVDLKSYQAWIDYWEAGPEAKNERRYVL